MAKNTNDANVTRITASDNSSPKRVKEKAPSKAKTRNKLASRNTTDDSRSKGSLGSFLGYFTGAWYELRQVRWPTRKATWSLTGAVLAFSAFFIVFILLIDAGFKFIFEQLLK